MTQQEYQHEVIVKLREAGTLKADGRYEEAVVVLHAVLAIDPECAPAFNNLGAIYFICKNYDLAVEAYQSALHIRPDYIDVYYNLGLAYIKMQREEEAMMAFRALIALAADHPGAHFQLGCLLMQRESLEQAASEFIKVADSYANHFESLANLALCQLRLGRMSQAAATYLRALDVVPDDPDTLYNLGVIYMQQGYTVQGAQYYMRAIKAKPDFFDAHHNLGAMYLMRRDKAQAIYHLQEALRIKPDAQAVQHTLRVLLNDQQLTGSSPEYIRSLFDSYADYYDTHMRVHLDYQVPGKFHALLMEMGVLSSHQITVLDLGCGTGLCGEWLKPYTKRLVGVDLSANMLNVARQKQIYDELVMADAEEYLGDHPAQFDLILAGDVLVYFGDLTRLASLACRALKPRGYWVFNVELTIDSDYALTSSGRFVHHESYLQRLAHDFGFKVVMMRPDSLRQQDASQVPGYLCLWQQSSG